MTSPARRAVILLGMLLLSGGCMPPLEGMIAEDAQVAFRQASLRMLVDAGQNDDPLIRMQAIECLKDVAPEEARPIIAAGLWHPDGRVQFAALMAIGELKLHEFHEEVKTAAERSDRPNVVVAALYALHRLGQPQRTRELADFLTRSDSPRVQANAALVLGRLGEPSAIKVLRYRLSRVPENDDKDIARFGIIEALAMLGDQQATERLIADGYSERPDQASTGLMYLVSAGSDGSKVRDLFYHRLYVADHPEIRLLAVRGLARLGYEDGQEIAARYLWFSTPRDDIPRDPPEVQIARIRALAALALGEIGSTRSLLPLKKAFELGDQPEPVRLAIAKAAIQIIDRHRQPAQRPADDSPPAARQARADE